MPKRIIYTQANGNAVLVSASPEYLLTHSMDECAIHSLPEGVEYFIVNTSDLPFEHNELFDAWEVVDGAIKVSFIKSQAITKDRLRQERTSLLAAQDVAFQRALETGSDITAIVDEKQRLRDVTKLADNATTLEELKALKA